MHFSIMVFYLKITLNITEPLHQTPHSSQHTPTTREKKSIIDQKSDWFK